MSSSTKTPPAGLAKDPVAPAVGEAGVPPLGDFRGGAGEARGGFVYCLAEAVEAVAGREKLVVPERCLERAGE